MNCMRCGAECSGQYCDNCAFYANNDQCWRCRMYLPKVELQQWRGQTYCPYCIMELRDLDKHADENQAENARKAREAEEHRGGNAGEPKDGYAGEEPRHTAYRRGSGSPPDETPFGSGQKTPEYKGPDYECDKCKGDLDIVYLVADHKFCEVCFQQQVREWKKAGIQQPYMKYRIKESPGLFIKLLDFLRRKINEQWEKRKKKGPK